MTSRAVPRSRPVRRYSSTGPGSLNQPCATNTDLSPTASPFWRRQPVQQDIEVALGGCRERGEDAREDDQASRNKAGDAPTAHAVPSQLPGGTPSLTGGRRQSISKLRPRRGHSATSALEACGGSSVGKARGDARIAGSLDQGAGVPELDQSGWPSVPYGAGASANRWDRMASTSASVSPGWRSRISMRRRRRTISVSATWIVSRRARAEDRSRRVDEVAVEVDSRMPSHRSRIRSTSLRSLQAIRSDMHT